MRRCQIVDAAYFRGRLTAQQAQDQDKLFADRIFEDVLMRENIMLFQRHLRTRPDGGFEEKGIDVWLALEAYEMASLKRYDVCVLVAGDGDFVPLVNKLNTLGARVMLIAWDFSYVRDGRTYITQAATELIDRANYPIMMNTEIDSRERRKDPLIDALFKVAMTSAPGHATQNTTAPAGDESSGVVHSFFQEKGFGFITPDNGGENLFFHISDLDVIDGSEVCTGLKVSFTTGRNDKGPCAHNIRKLTHY